MYLVVVNEGVAATSPVPPSVHRSRCGCTPGDRHVRAKLAYDILSIGARGKKGNDFSADHTKGGSDSRACELGGRVESARRSGRCRSGRHDRGSLFTAGCMFQGFQVRRQRRKQDDDDDSVKLPVVILSVNHETSVFRPEHERTMHYGFLNQF